MVHFIRHGEGFHNIGWEDNLDAHLTDFGWQQAAALGAHIRAQQPPLDIQARMLRSSILPFLTIICAGSPALWRMVSDCACSWWWCRR